MNDAGAFVLASRPVDRGRGWHATLTAPDGRVAALTLRAIDDAGDPPLILDGLVAAVLPAVMRVGRRLAVRGPVTHGALRQLTAFTEAWANWRPARFQPVTIIPDAVVRNAAPPSDHTAVIAWSGGLRST